jgi:hypothetical protein
MGLAMEPRQLLAALSGSFGEVLVPPTATDLDIPSDGLFVSDGFEVVGGDADRGARQAYSASGAGNAVEYFESLLSAGGGTGSNRGFVSEAVPYGDAALYVGNSAGMADPVQPTYWLSPILVDGGSGATGSQVGGGYLALSNSDGRYVGSSTNAVFGDPGELPQGLPGLGAFVAVDISSNGEFIAGSLLWQADGSGYDVYSTSSFDFTTSGGVPSWRGVEVDDAGNAYFAGEYFNLTTFETEVGFWSEAGEFLGSLGSDFADFDIVNGEVIAAVNSGSEGWLVRPSDMSSVAISDLIGSPATFPAKGLFTTDGQLGLLLENSSGPFVTVIETLDTPTVITVDSAVHQGNYAPHVLSMSTKTLQLALRGTATFDVTQLDRATLFVGDERNTVSGKITSIKFTDVNADGFRDAVIKVQTSTALRADTTRLRITGRTLTGEEFDGSRTVTMTTQTWQAHWQATSGSGWRTIFDAYKRGLKRTWW